MPLEKEWNTSRVAASDVRVNSWRGSGSCSTVSSSRLGVSGPSRAHAREHGGIREARVLLAVEDVVGAGRDVGPVRLRHAHAALHDARDVEVSSSMWEW